MFLQSQTGVMSSQENEVIFSMFTVREEEEEEAEGVGIYEMETIRIQIKYVDLHETLNALLKKRRVLCSCLFI